MAPMSGFRKYFKELPNDDSGRLEQWVKLLTILQLQSVEHKSQLTGTAYNTILVQKYTNIVVY